jgi:hypothetical protein
MRGRLAALAGLMLTFGSVGAMAAPATITADGRCDVNVNTGRVVGGGHCKTATVSRDAKTGEVILRFDFADGLTMEMEGPGLAVSAVWLMMSPGRMSWTNPGDSNPQVLANQADSPRDQLSGRCAIALQNDRTQIQEIYCNLKTAVGDIDIEFKVPKA